MASAPGESLEGSFGRSSEGSEEVVVVPSECFSADFEACLVIDIADEVEAHVTEGGHVGWAIAAAQSHEVVMEDDVHDPVQAVLDMPVGTHGGGELLCGKPGGGEKE